MIYFWLNKVEEGESKPWIWRAPLRLRPLSVVSWWIKPRSRRRWNPRWPMSSTGSTLQLLSVWKAVKWTTVKCVLHLYFVLQRQAAPLRGFTAPPPPPPRHLPDSLGGTLKSWRDVNDSVKRMKSTSLSWICHICPLWKEQIKTLQSEFAFLQIVYAHSCRLNE